MHTPEFFPGSTRFRIVILRLTWLLTVSNIINTDQLLGWYKKDDVLAVWKEGKGSLCLYVHCYVGGPNLFHDLAAEFIYHIFSKELLLVLRAVLHGDSALFSEHPDLDEAVVWVYFHSSSAKYNRVECWGSLRDASQLQRQQGEEMHAIMSKDDKGSEDQEKWGMRKSFLQALFAFILL
ncbi:Magnesium dechelatase SGRL, chloroplastic-like protein [Drosera capensis]